MRVLITGGAGFVGSHLADACAARGDDIVVIDSLRTGRRENLAGVDCEFHEDTIEDLDAVKRAMRGAEVVFHLAAMVSPAQSMHQPELTESINTGGTLNVLTAAREEGVRRAVFSSTCAIYGDSDTPMRQEDQLPAPISPYAVTKLAGEHYARIYREAWGLQTVCLRYFNVFGPRQLPDSPYSGVVSIFCARALANEPIRIHGDGTQTRDFISVHDVVAANLLAAGSNQMHGVYNVSSAEVLSVNDLAEKLIALAGSESAVEHGPAREGDIRHSIGDNTRLRSMGWEPKVPLEEGLRATLQAARDHRDGKT